MWWRCSAPCLFCLGIPLISFAIPHPYSSQSSPCLTAPVFAVISAFSVAMAAMAQASLVGSTVRLGAASSVVRAGETQLLSSSSRVSFAGVSKVQLRRKVVATPRASATTTFDIEELLVQLKGMTLEQARTLTDRLSEDLGVSAMSFAPAAAGAAPGAAAGEAAAVVEEKTEFDLVLEEVPSSARIACIKVVRTLTSLGLKEAKDMIESLPKKVKEAMTKEEAEEAKKALEAAGAKCSVK